MTLKGQINFENILIHQGYLDQQVILKLFAIMIAFLENHQDGESQGGFMISFKVFKNGSIKI